MNLAHIHLVLNHIPIMTIPIALIFYLFAVFRKNEQCRKFSLLILTLTAATVIPVFLTGEPAEEIVEHLTGVSKSLIHHHEESAEIALIFTLITGLTSFVTLVFTEKLPIIKRHGEKIVIISSLIALGTLIYAANLGGKIRHPELNIGNALSGDTSYEHSNNEDD